MTKRGSKPELNNSLAGSKINRSGLSTNTPAPEFRLPTIDGREISLSDFHGKSVLLVFSDPTCSPCTLLAPYLELIHNQNQNVQVLMISRGSVESNQAKISELGLTFPIVLQKQWEVSRKYGMFATPIAYLINEQGIITADVAVGVDSILDIVTDKEQAMREQMQTRLEALRKEFETGRTELEKVERQRIHLRETMLRISGAMQVLEELLTQEQSIGQSGVDHSETQLLLPSPMGSMFSRSKPEQ